MEITAVIDLTEEYSSDDDTGKQQLLDNCSRNETTTRPVLPTLDLTPLFAAAMAAEPTLSIAAEFRIAQPYNGLFLTPSTLHEVTVVEVESDDDPVDVSELVRKETGRALSANRSRFGKRRLVPGRQFFVTILNVDNDDSVKRNFLSAFGNTIYLLMVYCVSIERSRTNEYNSTSGPSHRYHMHAFLEFVHAVFVTGVRYFIAARYPNHVIDVQPCRNKKNCLTYISKKDPNPFYNCKLDDLHFVYRARVWASETASLDLSDEFLIEHRSTNRFLRDLHGEMHRNQRSDTFVGLRPIDFTFVCPWAIEFACAWNRLLAPKRNRFEKRRQIYLYGPSGTGKSSLVASAIGARNMCRVFQPDVGKFAYERLDLEFHRVILFEEFLIETHSVSMLKLLLEGATFTASVRWQKPKTIKFTGPVIMVSEEMNIGDQALLARLHVIEATKPCYESPRGPLPKEEVATANEPSTSGAAMSRAEVYEISSDSD